MNEEQVERYARHILLPEIGGRGQQRLLDSVVEVGGTCVGADTAATYLCAAGVGTLRLDADLVKRRGDALKALNADCTVTADRGPVDMTVAPEPTRLDGALAAQRVIMSLCSAAVGEFTKGWAFERRGGRWD